jgi:TRAP-type C4-dicarboxylate transport system permease large subunit
MFWKALGALGLPVLILGGIYGGIFTPTESAAVGIVYAVILGFALGELKVKDFPQNLDCFFKDLHDGEFHHCGRLAFLLGCF